MAVAAVASLAGAQTPQYVLLSITGLAIGVPVRVTGVADDYEWQPRGDAEIIAASSQLLVLDNLGPINRPIRYRVETVGPRTNVLPNPSFEVDTSNWSVGGGGILTRVTTDHTSGVAACLFSGPANASTFSPAAIYTTGVLPGDVWTASAYVKGTAGASARIGINFYNGGAAVQTTFSTFTLTGGWDRIHFTSPVPPTANGMRHILRLPTTEYLVDAAMLENASTLGAYIEGTATTPLVAYSNEITVPYAGDYVMSSLDSQAVVGFVWHNNADPREQRIEQYLTPIPGRRNPVMRFAPAGGDSGTWAIVTRTAAETRALYDLVAAGAPVLMRTTGDVRDFEPAIIVAVTGASRALYGSEDATRMWDLAWTEVDDPLATIPLAGDTFADVDAGYAGTTFADLDAAYAGTTFSDFNVHDWAGNPA